MKTEKTRAWPAVVALIAYSALLIYLAAERTNETAPGGISLLRLQSLGEAYDWIVNWSQRALLDIVRFIPVGFLLPLAFPRVERRSGRFFFVAVPALFISIVLSGVILGFEFGYPWQMPGSLDMILPALGCVLGIWMGMSWLQGPASLFMVLPKLAFAAIVAGSALLILFFLATEPTPLPFEARDVTPAEKRELLRLFRQGGQVVDERDATERFTLSQRSIDSLLAWALSLGPGEKKAKAELGPGNGSLYVSVGLPVGAEETRYVNWTTGVQGGVENGDLDLRVNAMTLGRLDAPGWLLNFFSPLVKTTVSHDRRIKPLLDATDELSVSPEHIEVFYTNVDLPRELLPYLLAGTNTNEDVREATRAQIEHLADEAGGFPRGDAGAGACLETAFAFARNRSAAGGSVAENTGAIFALGIVLGHPGLENFIGPVASDRLILRTRDALGDVTIRGRSDWPKHFFLSAGLAALSSEELSDAAGVLKEELDAREGGSGFSFADLLADRTGTTFALTAIRDEASATAVQERLATGFNLEDFVPEADGLPEDLPESEFQSKYGGVGGSEYNRIAAEIERRIKACPAYQ